MAFKPVGVDEQGRFPARVEQRLKDTFVTNEQLSEVVTGDPVALTDAAMAGAIQGGTTTYDVLASMFMPITVLKPTIRPPEGFRGLTALPTPSLTRKVGQITPVLDIDALRPSEGRTVWVSPVPISGRPGTPEQPMRLTEAIKDATVGTIILMDGEYSRIESSYSGPITRPINWLSAAGARPRVTCWDSPNAHVWTRTNGHIYQTTRSATVSVVDLLNDSSWGDHLVYERVADLSALTTPGKWTIVGSTVYVWCIGDTDLSVPANRAQIRLQVTANGGVYASGVSAVQYVEGVDFYGCYAPSAPGGIYSTTGATIIAKDVRVKYNGDSDGFTTKSGGHLIAIDCEASSNGRDGFNYHNTQGSEGEFIEIECNSHHNGLQVGVGTNNATTAHEAITGIRVNGTYVEAGGPVVADVNSAHSWNVACHAGGQAVPVASSQRQSWRVDGSAPVTGAGLAQMWLDECTASDAQYAFGATTGAMIYVHGVGWDNAAELFPGSVPIIHYARR